MSPLRIAADQFRPEEPISGRRQADPRALAFTIPALVVAIIVVAKQTHLTAAPVLLTSTSILTGLTFTMTTTFWSRSLDARKDPATATRAVILQTLDDARHHLLWTVLVGLATTGVLALTALFASEKGAVVWASALCAALVIYLLTLVGVAVQRFAEAAMTLR